jgi:hypothetical protein
MNENMSIMFAYSYDMQITGSLSGTGGAHEISLILDIGNVGFTGSNTYSRNRVGVNRAPTRSGRGALECSPFF